MRGLLDTHAFVWFVLNDPANDRLLSPASCCEIAISL
jgi:PIN domain nuclease of toxin-antitoxin system